MPVGDNVTVPSARDHGTASPGVWDRLFRNSSFQAITRATPLSTLGHIVNVTIAVAAFQSSAPWGPLVVWAVASYAVAAYVFYRWATRSRRKRRTADTSSSALSPSATRRAFIYGAMLAAPWGVLGFWLLADLPQQQELILIALCVGMSASGSVLLSASYPAAIAYMACVLAPVALKCFLLLDGREYLLLGTLTLSYAVFLINCINSCARLFAEKNRAVEELGKSLAEAENARREIEHAALHDALTGLPNRRAFLSHTLTLGDNSDRALFYVDLDRFKPINDAFGHAVGDKLLQAVATRLNAGMQQGEFIARLGGDEFTLLVSGVANQREAEARAAATLDTICRPYSIDGLLITVGASIGISLAGREFADMAQLLKAADLALYEAKHGSTGRYYCYQPSMLTKVEARQRAESSLRLAVADQQFELHYQPIVELTSLRLTGAEALIRWHHPQRGLILPGEFLPLAEEMQLLHSIEAWVLEEACRQAALWPEHLHVAVNLSPSRVAHTEIATTVAAILAATGLDPARLELEVTESAILNDDSNTHRKLCALKALGVSLAMDDFGTGYSSLAYLSRFPFDRIKIDRTFVDGLLKDNVSATIVRATMDMARSLGLRTTAEGVETQLQLSKLQSLGIELGQGHLFSKPVPAGALPALFLRGSLLDSVRNVVAADILRRTA